MAKGSWNLNFTQAFLLLGGIVILVAILFWVLTFFNQQRKDSVYKTYATETQDYISKNRDKLEVLFTQVFPNETCYSSDKVTCPVINGDAIGRTVPSDLKDWSSTEFIKLSNNKVLKMKLSGDVSEQYNFSTSKQDLLITKLLKGEVNEVPWDNYVYDFPGKQVIIPVKNTQGKVIGAIIRGVIE